MQRTFFKSAFAVILVCLGLLILFAPLAPAHDAVRTEINIPDIPGYKTLKCDFHMHTVFSDGNVWPTVRVEEAWREGLDAIAITDHIEYQPHKKDIPTNHNRSFEIANPTAKTLGIILIRGAEITRSMPPGHLNAIFIQDANLLDVKDYNDALKNAAAQGAFIFWNHPGWKGQQPDGIGKWYNEHTEILQKGWLHGIEVVNTIEYYPEAQTWCLEKKLTMMGNSDIHHPINMDYNISKGDHRPMTLVFVKERNEEAIKAALFAGRTAVYTGNQVIGEAKYLQPIFAHAIEILNPEIQISGKGPAVVQIHNGSDISFVLEAINGQDEIDFPQSVTLAAHKTVPLVLKTKQENASGEKAIKLQYSVKNLLVAPQQGLPVDLPITVVFAGAGE